MDALADVQLSISSSKKGEKMKNFMIILTIIVVLLGRTVQAKLTTWYVHPCSTLSTIQIALDSCSSGDIVIVGAGIYSENIEWPKTQGINLISEYGPDFTIIQSMTDAPVIKLLNIIDSETEIKGFTIRNGNATNGGGVYCYNSSPTIKENKIISNIASYNGAGIYCYQSKAHIIGNIIQSNRASFLGGGIYITHNSSVIIKKNKFYNNSALQGGGMAIEEATVKISGDVITNNSSGVYLINTKGTIDSCVISYNHSYGVYNAYSINRMSVPSVHYCNIVNNLGYGIYNNYFPEAEMSATNNWWGDPMGPDNVKFNANNKVYGLVNYDPCLLAPVGSFEEGNNSLFTKQQTCTTIFSGSLKLLNGDIYKLYDITGREITLGEMKAGVYFIQINGKMMKRVVKIK